MYLHTIVHELRTPLVSIQGFTSLLAENFQTNLPGEGTKYLERILSNLSKIDNLLTDITRLAKVVVNECEFQKVAVRAIIEAALESLAMEIMQNKTQFQIQPNLPEIYCDFSAMTQVYTNLLSNAIKYANARRACQIVLGYREDEIFHKFFVQDNGVGIRAKDRDKVFNLFSRLHNKNNVQGSGIGLAIVKRIIQGHGGEIWVDSRKNKGTTIFFTLPKRSP
ncbi:MAG: ATP-binding protein [bacterium]